MLSAVVGQRSILKKATEWSTYVSASTCVTSNYDRDQGESCT